ncbi:MAG: metallophosphoesterase [Ruminococcus sp.]|nr:metallophosphoesterase [Ruminococcus sp.]
MSAAAETDKKRRRFIAFCLVLLVTVTLFIAGYEPETVRYTLTSGKLRGEVRIVFVSDLHNCIYGGTDQSGLMADIDREEPDIVIFGGDVIDGWNYTANALTAMRKAAEKYPCFYTPGNHEFMRNDTERFLADAEKTGVKLIMGGYEQISIRGSELRIYGAVDATYKGQLKECFSTLDGSYYNILIAHKPEQIDKYLGSGSVRFDLILSGHAHGGQWRLPGLLGQGLYAPDQGIFPERTCGKYTYGDTVQIISRGLAKPLRMIFIPRIFNRPELTAVELKPEVNG